MTVTGIEKDEDALTLTLTAEFAAPAEQVWELWNDPRRLERWWGPPEYPATFTALDLRAGGSGRYFMTGPDGEQYHGEWAVDAVEPGRSIELHDYFTGADGVRSTEMPVSVTRVRLTEQDGTTRMVLSSSFETLADMQKLLEMQMDEGLRQAVSQMDALLAG